MKSEHLPDLVIQLSLCVCFFDKSLGISKTVPAFLFKFEDAYQKFHNDILYFCNCFNQTIDLNNGWYIYHSIQHNPR